MSNHNSAQVCRVRNGLTLTKESCQKPKMLPQAKGKSQDGVMILPPSRTKDVSLARLLEHLTYRFTPEIGERENKGGKDVQSKKCGFFGGWCSMFVTFMQLCNLSIIRNRLSINHNSNISKAVLWPIMFLYSGTLEQTWILCFSLS